jgi:ferric enterobactin receptor
MNSKNLLCILFTLIPFAMFGQRYEVSGRVTSGSNSEAIYFATIYTEGTQYSSFSNDKGEYRIQLPKGEHKLKVAFLGYETQERVINVTGELKSVNFTLKEMSLSLNEVVVTATTSQSKEGSSTYSIGSEAIKQVQAISLSDVMSLLPGGKLQPQRLTSTAQLNLRTTESNAVNSFGTAIVIDGTPLSNDANLQVQNPASSLSGGTNVANRGLDLREIPASNIESVEVVTGVASARYGNITSGAVIVTRRAGYSPLNVSFNSTPTTYQASVSRGLKLNKRGYLNLDADYAYSVGEPTELKYYFNRINIGARWTSTFNEERNWSNTLSASYGFSGDGRRAEPQEVLLSNRDIKNSRVMFGVNGRLDLLGRLNYTLSFNLNSQYTKLEQEVTDGPRPMIEPTETGTYFTTYTPLSYMQTTIMKGMPVNAYLRVETEQNSVVANNNLSFTTGIEYTFDKNYGKGRIGDDGGVGPAGLPGSRGVLFHDIPASKNFSMYHQTVVTREFESIMYNLRLGLRYDRMIERYNLLSPRLSGTLGLGKSFKIRGAWGISYKAPSMITLYPGPVYFDIVNLSYYHPVPEERLAIVTSYVIRPDNSTLKPGRGETREIAFEFDKSGFNVRVTGYHKLLSRGITSATKLGVFENQGYKIVSQPAGRAPVVEKDPENITYLPRTYSEYVNNQRSDTKGFELTFAPPRIKRTNTGINLTGQYVSSRTLDDVPAVRVSNTSVSKSRYGVYNSWVRSIEVASANLTLIQQIPDLRIIVTLTTELNLYNKTVNLNPDLLPVAYYDVMGNQIDIPESERGSEEYKDLRLSPTQMYPSISPFYPNFHLNIRKETKQGHSFTFYANNCFWYNPYYTNEYSNSRYSLNGKISFGFGISFKI